jgi:hypothetical protein
MSLKQLYGKQRITDTSIIHVVDIGISFSLVARNLVNSKWSEAGIFFFFGEP